MTDIAAPNNPKPPVPPKNRHKWAKVVVIFLGCGLIGWQLYAFCPPIRVGVVHVLGAIGPRATPSVIGYGVDDSGEVQKAAIEVLDKTREGAVPALKESLTHADVRRRRFAAGMLDRLGPAAASAVPALAEAGTSDSDVEVRRAAIQALCSAGLDNEDVAIPALIQSAGDAETSIREQTAKSLARFGSKAKGATLVLAGLLKDPSSEVRRQAAEALEQIGPDARAAIPALTKALEDPDAGVRKEVKEALESIGPAPTP